METRIPTNSPDLDKIISELQEKFVECEVYFSADFATIKYYKLKREKVNRPACLGKGL